MFIYELIIKRVLRSVFCCYCQFIDAVFFPERWVGASDAYLPGLPAQFEGCGFYGFP